MTTARRLLALLTALFLLPLLAVTVTSAATAAGSGAPAAGDGLFRANPGLKVSSLAAPRVRPRQYRAYDVDLAGVRALLGRGGPVSISLPDPAGTPTSFTVAEDSVMDPSMQAAHPDIRTYAGTAANGTSVRLDVTPLGFHAMVRRPDGVSWFIDPATNSVGEDRVLSYAGAAVGAAPEPFVEKELMGAAEQAGAAVGDDFSTPGGIVTQRTYRLAFLTDPAYAAYNAPGAATHGTSDPLVLAAKTTLINRVNEVYNDDVAYTFTLVAGTDTKLNLLTTAEFSGANGPCGANACFPGATGAYDCGNVLDRNAFALGQLVGADTFDIGHIGLGVNGGGVAGLGVVGGANKARGCTGLPQPVGDFYAIDYVAHEMGHQMGGNHTFDGPQGNCGPGNRNNGTSVEPGSGSSIMAYAGICGTDDLQPHSDPYFSFKSIDEFEATTAAARSNLSERQTVRFTGLDAGEQFTITCSGCGTSSTVTFTGNGATDQTAIAAAVASVTSAATITNYDTATGTPTAAGFTATWASTTDQPRLVINVVSGTFTPQTGVVVNGGPQTNGGTTTATTNHSPVVTVPANKTIPIRTPFTLNGSATDSDGDTLRYSWEQTDTGGGSGTGLVNNNKTDGPLFRQFGFYANVSDTDTLLYHSPGENIAGTSPSRTFPDLAQILAGNTNAATGSCPTAGAAPVAVPIVECYSEFLPTSVYTANGGALHFRLLARDNYTFGGGTHPGGVSWGDMTLSVSTTAGPFLVTSRATAGTPGSGFENITWAVNNTQTLAPNVKISLSTDGGQTFPTVLAASTPNDGAESVILPNVTTSTARIKIEAVDNYFFDINDANFSIQPSGGNLTPVVDAGPGGSVAVGTPFTGSGTFNDETPATATATVDYGDGTGVQPLVLNPVARTFALNHTYTTAGTKTVTVRVTDASAATGTDTTTVTVTTPAPSQPAASSVTASAKPKKVTQGKTVKVKVAVSSSGGVPAGTVQVYKGKKLLGTGTLKNGKVVIKLSKKAAKKLKVGKNKLTVKYLGSATIAASQDTLVVKVIKKKKR